MLVARYYFCSGRVVHLDKIVKYYTEKWDTIDQLDDWIWRIRYNPSSSSERTNGTMTIFKKGEEFRDSIEIFNPQNPDLPDYLSRKGKNKIIRDIFSPE